MKNVLFLGGGRRVELATRFKEAGWKLFSYETSYEVPISLVATVIKGKLWKDQLIYYDIINIIYKYDIELVIPLQDEAVVIASRLKEFLANDEDISILASPVNTALTCFDKLKFEIFMKDNFKDNYPEFNFSFPTVVKPRFGFGSRGIIEAKNYAELHSAIGINPTDFVLQRKISGVEYSIDSYFDNNGNWVDSVPRERIRTCSGEVLTSKTVYDETLINITKAVNSSLGIIGPSNTQIIVDRLNKPYIIEVNARFGGGYTLSIESGLDIINLIERDYFNGKCSYTPGSWKKSLLLERSYTDHYFYLNYSN